MEERVFVTYRSLEIASLPALTTANLTINANALTGGFPNLLTRQGLTTFDPLDTTFPVNFAPGESRSIQLGFSMPGICQGQGILGKDQISWQGVTSALYELASPDGNCKMVVEVNGGKPPVALPQQPGALPQSASLVTINLPVIETGTVEVPVLESGTVDWSSAVQWNGAVITGDNAQNRQMHGLITFDLSALPKTNNGLGNAILTINGCRYSGIYSFVQPFQVNVLTGAYRLPAMEKGQCSYSQSMSGIIQDILVRGRFSKLTIQISPTGVDPDNDSDSIEFTEFKLSVSYYP